MQRIRRTGIVGGVVALVAGMVATVAPAQASPVALQQADFEAYATGTVVHADALESPDQNVRLLDVEEAFSGAVASPQGIDPRIKNEVDRVVAPQGANAYYARGSGLEVGVAHPPDGDNQIIEAGLAESKDGENVTEEHGPLPAEPLAYASALRGQAFTAGGPSDCNLGGDLARGLGFAADAQLLDQDQEANGDERLDQPVVATDAPDPERAVAQSTSRVRLVPQVSKSGKQEGDNLGVMSETRMTIAPLTLGGQVTVEFLGEWVLRAVATGKSGYVHYGPGEESPSTPILRVIDQAAGEVTDIVTFQEFFGTEGVVVPIEPLGIELALGEDPRAIGGNADSKPTETATLASAAVDVVRVRALDVPDTGGTVSDLRVGHMEVKAEAPPDGITCGLDVSKSVNRDVVMAGEDFVYTVTVGNPFDCKLTRVRLEDVMTETEGVMYDATGASDGGVVNGKSVTWADVGPLGPGDERSVTIDVSTDPASAAGRITDDVTATAKCGVATADGKATVQVPVSANAHLPKPEVRVPGDAPEVKGATENQPTGDLPRTGGPLALLAGAGFFGGGMLVQRLLKKS